MIKPSPIVKCVVVDFFYHFFLELSNPCSIFATKNQYKHELLYHSKKGQA